MSTLDLNPKSSKIICMNQNDSKSVSNSSNLNNLQNCSNKIKKCSINEHPKCSIKKCSIAETPQNSEILSSNACEQSFDENFKSMDVNFSDYIDKDVVLHTIRTRINDQNINILLDNGSNFSSITNDCAKKLGLAFEYSNNIQYTIKTTNVKRKGKVIKAKKCTEIFS